MKIECPFCRSKISDEAVVCPYCQAEKIVFEREIKPNYIKTLLQAVLTPIFASLFLYFFILNSTDQQMWREDKFFWIIVFVIFGLIIFVKGILTAKETVVKWQRKSSL